MVVLAVPHKLAVKQLWNLELHTPLEAPSVAISYISRQHNPCIWDYCRLAHPDSFWKNSWIDISYHWKTAWDSYASWLFTSMKRAWKQKQTTFRCCGCWARFSKICKPKERHARPPKENSHTSRRDIRKDTINKACMIAAGSEKS